MFLGYKSVRSRSHVRDISCSKTLSAMGVTIHFRWKNFFICFAISLGALAYGYLAAIISTTMGKPAFLMYMGLGDESGEVFHDKENLQGAITSVFQVLYLFLLCSIC